MSPLLHLALPEVALTLTALGLLALQGFRPNSRAALPFLAAAGLLLAALSLLFLPPDGDVAKGMLIASPLCSLAKLIILALAFIAVLLTPGALDRSGLAFSRHLGEYLALTLLATIGLLVFVSSNQLLVIFIGLELAGLSLYITSAFDKTDPRGTEAGMRYFLFGSVASAFTLFGLSFIYGSTGSTHLPGIAEGILDRTSSPLLAAGVVMTLSSLAFKIAATPMHLWAPDTYQAAPLPTAAFIASASKVAAFLLLGRMLLTAFAPAQAVWAPALAIIAALSIIAGNLTALAQKNFRRLLAYSAVAHAGYTLLGLLSGNPAGFSATLFYSATYGFAILGAFTVSQIARCHTGSDTIAELANLRRRSPLLAAALAIFLLSLAGLPPLVGFFGKFNLFYTAYQASPSLLWLIALALAGSLVSLYYYLSVLKAALVDSGDAVKVSRIPLSLPQKNLLIALAAITLALGLLPGALLQPVRKAVEIELSQGKQALPGGTQAP